MTQVPPSPGPAAAAPPPAPPSPSDAAPAIPRRVARPRPDAPGSGRGIAIPLYVAYFVAAAWLLGAGWLRLIAPDGRDATSLALFAALVMLTAVPLVMRLLFAGVIVQEVGRAATAVSQARRAARDSARTKAEFLATMSHEVRTPLNGIVGFAELLGKTDLDAKQREFADAIRESSAHLLSIINDVLDYSKIDAGRVELEEKPIDVAVLVESCRKAVSVAAAKRGLALHFQVGPGMPPALFGDATRIRQVLLNLLSNAVKFTERGEIRVTAHGHRESDGRYAVSFEVQDTGIGLSPHDQKRLFKAFTQVDPSSTRSHGGTGLGLAISQRLCRLMGGDLTVQSELGKGSTFVATIRVPAAPEPVPSVATRALRGMRVMVVEDSPLARSVVARNCQAWGMLTRSTGDPDRAMQWLRAGDPFDVAILGHRRGGLNAIRLAERIRAAGHAALPLVLAAAPMDLLSPPPRLFAAGVAMPVQAAQLVASLHTAVDRPRRASPSEPAPAPGKPSDLRILLVEDNDMNRTLSLRILEGLGYRADVAVNGLEAVKAVGPRRYDVVLMDVQMPVMDGLEATRAIYRKLPPRERPVIIGLSANALPGDREQCLRAGMDEYAPKPTDQARLATMLAAVARRRRTAKAGAVAPAPLVPTR